MIQNIIPQHTIRLMVPAERIVKKTSIKNPHIEALKEQLKGNMLPEVNIPNSHAAKKSDIIDATATLIYAKSLNRPVRRAQSYECQAYNETQLRLITVKESVIGPREASSILGIKMAKFTDIKNKYKLKSCTVKQGRDHYSKKEVEAIKYNHGPFYLD